MEAAQQNLGEKIAKNLHVAAQLLQEVSVPGGARVSWRISVKGEMDIDLAVHFQANAGLAGRRDPERDAALANMLPGDRREATTTAELMGLQTRTTGYARNLRRVVVAQERIEVASGSYQTPKDGMLVFIFDNSYSWINEKDVELEVLLPPAGAAGRLAAMVPPGVSMEGAVMNPLLAGLHPGTGKLGTTKLGTTKPGTAAPARTAAAGLEQSVEAGDSL